MGQGADKHVHRNGRHPDQQVMIDVGFWYQCLECVVSLRLVDPAERAGPGDGVQLDDRGLIGWRTAGVFDGRQRPAKQELMCGRSLYNQFGNPDRVFALCQHMCGRYVRMYAFQFRAIMQMVGCYAFAYRSKKHSNDISCFCSQKRRNITIYFFAWIAALVLAGRPLKTIS